MAQHNPWEDYLNENFGIAFNAFRPQQGSSSFLDFSRGLQGRAFQDYQAALGQQALSGQAPSLEPVDFFSSYPFLQRFLEQTRSQRGLDDRNFAPVTRFL